MFVRSGEHARVPLRATGDSESDDNPGLTASFQASLERQWANATVEVIHAEREYAALVSQGVADDETVGAAWLRLWRAQQRQRELSSELDRIET
jgi:hypothetical protein